MKIFFQQPHNACTLLEALGVRQCYVKKLSGEKDAGSVLRRFHHHNGFEIHLQLQGEEEYETAEGVFTVQAGQYLLIPPRLPHRSIRTAAEAVKNSITFSLQNQQMHALFAPLLQHCICAGIPSEVLKTLAFISQEAGSDPVLSPVLIANRTAEILVHLARAAGYQPAEFPLAEQTVDPRLAMARQYIQDNIARPLSCDEVAAYCHLSTRQLSRLFAQNEEKTLNAFIHQQRIACIERMLANPALTLRQISEQMHFSSEYYFNAFVKKHAGMTPGAYRRMIIGKSRE